MSNENSGNVLPSDYCCHLFDFAKLAKIYKFRFANSWFDSPMATWRTLTGTLHIDTGFDFWEEREQLRGLDAKRIKSILLVLR